MASQADANADGGLCPNDRRSASASEDADVSSSSSSEPNIEISAEVEVEHGEEVGEEDWDDWVHVDRHDWWRIPVHAAPWAYRRARAWTEQGVRLPVHPKPPLSLLELGVVEPVREPERGGSGEEGGGGGCQTGFGDGCEVGEDIVVERGDTERDKENVNEHSTTILPPPAPLTPTALTSTPALTLSPALPGVLAAESAIRHYEVDAGIAFPFDPLWDAYARSRPYRPHLALSTPQHAWRATVDALLGGVLSRLPYDPLDPRNWHREEMAGSPSTASESTRPRTPVDVLDLALVGGRERGGEREGRADNLKKGKGRERERERERRSYAAVVFDEHEREHGRGHEQHEGAHDELSTSISTSPSTSHSASLASSSSLPPKPLNASALSFVPSYGPDGGAWVHPAESGGAYVDCNDSGNDGVSYDYPPGYEHPRPRPHESDPGHEHDLSPHEHDAHEHEHDAPYVSATYAYHFPSLSTSASSLPPSHTHTKHAQTQRETRRDTHAHTPSLERDEHGFWNAVPATTTEPSSSPGPDAGAGSGASSPRARSAPATRPASARLPAFLAHPHGHGPAHGHGRARSDDAPGSMSMSGALGDLGGYAYAYASGSDLRQGSGGGRAGRTSRTREIVDRLRSGRRRGRERKWAGTEKEKEAGEWGVWEEGGAERVGMTEVEYEGKDEGKEGDEIGEGKNAGRVGGKERERRERIVTTPDGWIMGMSVDPDGDAESGARSDGERDGDEDGEARRGANASASVRAARTGMKEDWVASLFQSTPGRPLSHSHSQPSTKSAPRSRSKSKSKSVSSKGPSTASTRTSASTDARTPPPATSPPSPSAPAPSSASASASATHSPASSITSFGPPTPSPSRTSFPPLAYPPPPPPLLPYPVQAHPAAYPAPPPPPPASGPSVYFPYGQFVLPPPAYVVPWGVPPPPPMAVPPHPYGAYGPAPVYGAYEAAAAARKAAK
ncbi:hypothetical protein EIP86_010065 [Pleurotus ostreatoroseus]|nr:hypothetical protein EIP86_010065 [Pleurotus ostreatoroseus]